MGGGVGGGLLKDLCISWDLCRSYNNVGLSPGDRLYLLQADTQALRYTASI